MENEYAPYIYMVHQERIGALRQQQQQILIKYLSQKNINILKR